jgi:hypothetical protein
MTCAATPRQIYCQLCSTVVLQLIALGCSSALHAQQLHTPFLMACQRFANGCAVQA